MVEIDLDRLEQRCRAPAVFEEQQRAKERAAFDALPALIAEVRRLRKWSGDASGLLRRLADVTYADDAEECLEMVDKLEASEC